jgi:hypothetical protein
MNEENAIRDEFDRMMNEKPREMIETSLTMLTKNMN